jgi:hypothetical protein
LSPFSSLDFVGVPLLGKSGGDFAVFSLLSNIAASPLVADEFVDVIILEGLSLFEESDRFATGGGGGGSIGRVEEDDEVKGGGGGGVTPRVDEFNVPGFEDGGGGGGGGGGIVGVVDLVPIAAGGGGGGIPG